MTTLTAKELWEIADTLKVGDRVYFEYKLPGGGRWKSDNATVTKETTDLAADPVERYGACLLDSDDNNIMLPQDGKNGTLMVEYRVFSVDRPVAFALSPDSAPPRAQVRPTPARTPAPMPTAPVPAPSVPLAVPQTLPPYLQEISQLQQLHQQTSSPVEFTTDVCLDPRSWHLLCTGEFETFRLKLWLREFFSGKSKQIGEDYIIRDLIAGIELQADVVCEQPAITGSSPWARSMELLISRLFVQRERRLGASPQQIEALQQGFTDAKLPEWIKGAKDTASTLLRFQGQPRRESATTKPSTAKNSQNAKN
jgi:hypothetical protein